MESEGDGRLLIEYAVERGLRLKPLYGEPAPDSGERDVYVEAGAGLSGDVKVVAEDMYIEAPARVTFAEVGNNIARKAPALWLPFLPADDCAAVGEMLMEYPANPLAPIYGELPRMTLGVEGLLGTGGFVRTGRRTVKGVVGYELTGLLIGSGNRLGLISRVRFRLWARPPARVVWAAVEEFGPRWDETLKMKRAVPFNLDGCPAVYAEGRREWLGALVKEIQSTTDVKWEEAATGDDALEVLGSHFDRSEPLSSETTGAGGLLRELGGPFYAAEDYKDGES
ncbi:MAG: FAD-binding oxidoreductase [Candidatus Coatesbacteria bacterium]|nr:MAG: FAD-binding oxidoreductase [Candidatus Coatesbacteria bacterium]